MKIGKMALWFYTVLFAALFSCSAMAESDTKVNKEYEQHTKTLTSTVLDEVRTVTVNFPKAITPTPIKNTL